MINVPERLEMGAGRPSYIYALCCPINGDVRYIGKANNVENRFKSHMRESIKRNYPVHCWIRKLAKNNMKPQVKILEETNNWQEAERRLIELARERGDKLLNLADGGNQPLMRSETQANNGRKNARSIHDNPKRKRLWRLKQQIGISLRSGYGSPSLKEKLRLAAIKHPDMFGVWANV